MLIEVRLTLVWLFDVLVKVGLTLVEVGLTLEWLFDVLVEVGLLTIIGMVTVRATLRVMEALVVLTIQRRGMRVKVRFTLVWITHESVTHVLVEVGLAVVEAGLTLIWFAYVRIKVRLLSIVFVLIVSAILGVMVGSIIER